MKQNIHDWHPDETQQKIINLEHGSHLVLAPPGCGKTQLMAERVRRAHADGVAYSDMLCLTFTNRAARGMRERISRNLQDEDVADVFVGNVHRFCSRFLFENGVVPHESAIIDDDTTVSILAMYLGEDEDHALTDSWRRRYYNDIVFVSHLMYEIEHHLDRRLRQHPECLTRDDIAVLKALCRQQAKDFTPEMLIDIYEHNDFYTDASHSLDHALRQQAEQTLLKMRYAHAYTAYKQQNNLLDFEDLLLMTYTALQYSDVGKRYSWIQVDEVQDLNLLQLSIIDELSTCHFDGVGSLSDDQGTVMYLGDEQQAIFSFMGAKLSTLEMLRQRCQRHVHHLGVNHRSPAYLVNLLNRYATEVLHVDGGLLPQPNNDMAADDDAIAIVPSDDLATEFADVAMRANQLSQRYPADTTAIIVNSNRDADTVSLALKNIQCPHFKVSGADLFGSQEVKLLMAHLSVVGNDHNFLAWSRLMKGLKVCQTNAAARQFVHQLEVRAMTPTDFLTPHHGEVPTYLQDFLRTWEEEEIVVFDTETTGLNVFEDDIIQIAAEKIRRGEVVDKFSIYVETDRHIPERLGDIVNPIIEERKHQRIYTHDYALRQFLAFVGDDVLLGHNANYDYAIMDFNIRRYLPKVDWRREHPRCFDSLKLVRLLRPDLKAFKLKLLLKELTLEGQNSHLADDDVFATVSLVNYCYEKGQELKASQDEYLSRKLTQDRIAALQKNYQDFYTYARSILYDRLPADQEPAILTEMKRMEEHARSFGVPHQSRLPYVYRFLRSDVIDTERETSLKVQLDAHIMEMNTFKEADLCNSSTIDDRIFVTTIHKAKGLEFDNVIVFDVVDGRIPNFHAFTNPAAMAEDARKLYVAMSRAKKRLYITWSKVKYNRDGKMENKLSRYLAGIFRN